MARKPKPGTAPAAAPKPSETPRMRLDAMGTDGLIERIVAGQALRDIARDCGAHLYSMQVWIAGEPERKARYDAAMKLSADWHAEQATAVIEALGAGATKADVARARELAQQHRWLAKMRDQSRYGDKLAVDHNVTPDAAEALGELRALFGIKTDGAKPA
jgi:hypothetical protein